MSALALLTLSGASALVLNRAAAIRSRSAVPQPAALAARVSTPPVLSAGQLPALVSTPDHFCSEHQHQLGSLAEYETMYEESVRDPSAFWSGIADGFHWEAPYSEVVSSNFDKTNGKVFSEWFKGGMTNLCYNALDRQVEAGRGGQVAFFHESNDEGEELASWTYSQTLDAVKRLASALKASGVRKGDRVTLFMPMVPQLPIAMLACARIGAVHSVVFGGFSAESLANRLQDAQSRVVITADGVMRGKKVIDLYAIASRAAEIVQGVSIDKQIVLQRLSADQSGVVLKAGRDVWWHDVLASAEPECPVEWVGAEHPLFILYTSGSTGKPKGVLHSTGGYMVFAATTTKYVFDLQLDDVYFCTADCGWITGHSYVTYGPLLNGATQLIFEGVPSFPDAGRLWRIVDKYSVTQLYTAPTAIRALMRLGNAPVEASSRASLKLLGSVGEPINPEAWRWYYEVVGQQRCPIVDTWWQTETGGIMIVPLPIPGANMKPGCAMRPFFGVRPVVIDEQGNEKEGPCEGLLAIKGAWPSTIRDVYGDYER
jgi:acetyl-CoA synthetase